MEFNVALKDNKEIEFIHDISNQIVIAQGGAGFVFSRLKKKNKFEEDELESMEKVTKAIGEITKLIQERKSQFRVR